MHFEETFPCENDVQEVKIYDIDYHEEIERILVRIRKYDEATKKIYYGRL